MAQREVTGVTVKMATPINKVLENIVANKDKSEFKWAHELPDWRVTRSAAIVGGGVTLKETWPEIKKHDVVFACGSVHDFLIEKGIIPHYTVVCDPDPLVLNYLRKPHCRCTYLIATQCAPEVFDYLDRNTVAKVVKWNAGGDHTENTIFGDPAVIVGGGCTVGTRGIILAFSLGFADMHLYGFDSCISNNVSHAYEFSDKDKEQLLEVQDITVGGKEFKVAGYMLGQLLDFKKILVMIGNMARFTVHGEGALYTLVQMGKDRKNGEEK